MKRSCEHRPDSCDGTCFHVRGHMVISPDELIPELETDVSRYDASASTRKFCELLESRLYERFKRLYPRGHVAVRVTATSEPPKSAVRFSRTRVRVLEHNTEHGCVSGDNKLREMECVNVASEFRLNPDIDWLVLLK